MTLTHTEIAYLIRLTGGKITDTEMTGQDVIVLRAKLEESLKETK